MSRRFMTSKPKRKVSEERVIHDEEFGEENVEQVDEEWAEFERVLHEYRERRLLNAANENMNKKGKKKRKKKTQTFYPCPPPSFSEADNDESDYTDEETEVDSSEDGFVTTLVSVQFETIFCMRLFELFVSLISCM